MKTTRCKRSLATQLLFAGVLTAAMLSPRAARAAVTINSFLVVAGSGLQPIDGRPVVGRELSLAYAVSSTYELTNIVVTVGSVSVTLQTPSTNAVVDISGLARGPQTVTFEVTEAFGGKATASKEVFHDNPPVLYIDTPEPEGVERGTSLLVRARCEDDDPAGCNYLRLRSAPLTSPVIAQGNTLEHSFSIAGIWDQGLRSGSFSVEAVDSAGWNTTEIRQYNLDRSVRLDIIENARGAIVDFDAERLLIRRQGSLAIQSRSTRALQYLTDRRTDLALLTDTGAVWVEPKAGKGTSCTFASSVRQLAGNQIYEIVRPCEGSFVFVDRNLVAWHDDVEHRLTRFSLSSRQKTTGAAWIGQSTLGIAPNGDAFTTAYSTTNRPILRERAGSFSEVATAMLPAQVGGLRTWISDRLLVICDEICETLNLATYALQSMTGVPAQFPQEPARLAGAWFGFQVLGPSGKVQVWRWQQGGTAERVTFFGSDSSLDALAPSGQLVVGLNAPAPASGPPETGELGQRGRYFIPANSTTPEWFTSTLEGRVVPRCDGWYVLLGAALMRANLPSMQAPFPCALSPGEPDAGSDAGTSPQDASTPSEDASLPAPDAEVPNEQDGAVQSAPQSDAAAPALADAGVAFDALADAEPTALDATLAEASTSGNDGVETPLTGEDHDEGEPESREAADGGACSAASTPGLGHGSAGWLIGLLAILVQRRRRASARSSAT